MTVLAQMIRSRRRDRSRHLCSCSEALLATDGMLAWHQTQPSRKVACLAEGLGRRGHRRDGRGDQRTNAGHSHQLAGHLVCLCPTNDLGIELAVLGLQMGQCLDQDLSVPNTPPGKPLAGSSTLAISFAVFAALGGTICPNSVRWPRRALMA
jgi:hypothetical protein